MLISYSQAVMSGMYDDIDPVSVQLKGKTRYRDIAPGANPNHRAYMQGELDKIQSAYASANSMATLRYGYKLARMGCHDLPDELCEQQVVDTERIPIDDVVDKHVATHLLKRPTGRVESVFSRV